jgi:HAD superfamily hydrolase (TIGR01509 family)
VIQLDWSRVVSHFGLAGTTHEPFVLHSLTRWEVYDRYERDILTSKEFQAQLSQYLGRPFDDPDFLRGWTSVLVRSVPGVEPVLAAVKKTTPLYALTNSNRAHCEWLNEHFPVAQAFDRIFTSFELKVRKPEAAAFSKVADAIGFSPGEILFVDDLEENVSAARRFGFRAERAFNSASELTRIFRTYGLDVPVT